MTKPPTVFAEGELTRTCLECGQKESIAIPKLTPTLTLNVTKLPLKVKQSTKKVTVSGLTEGDYVQSWTSGNTKVVTVSSSGKIQGKKVGKRSSNKKVVSVSAKGAVKAKAPGKAKITVSSGKKKVTVAVTVTKK